MYYLFIVCWCNLILVTKCQQRQKLNSNKPFWSFILDLTRTEKKKKISSILIQIFLTPSKQAAEFAHIRRLHLNKIFYQHATLLENTIGENYVVHSIILSIYRSYMMLSSLKRYDVQSSTFDIKKKNKKILNWKLFSLTI